MTLHLRILGVRKLEQNRASEGSHLLATQEKTLAELDTPHDHVSLNFSSACSTLSSACSTASEDAQDSGTSSRETLLCKGAEPRRSVRLEVGRPTGQVGGLPRKLQVVTTLARAQV